MPAQALRWVIIGSDPRSGRAGRDAGIPASLARSIGRQGVVALVHLHIPRIGEFVRHAVPTIVLCTVLPVGLFLLGLELIGPWGAMMLGLAWSYGLIAAKLVTRARVPGLLIVGSATLTARTVIAAASGSVFVYFLQPSLGTALVAVAFAASVPLGRPLAERLARDFVPFPPEVFADQRVRRFFLQISLLWAVTQFANAAITIWLLFTQSVGTFVVARTAVSTTLTGFAIAASTAWFFHSMARHGIVVSRRRAVRSNP